MDETIADEAARAAARRVLRASRKRPVEAKASARGGAWPVVFVVIGAIAFLATAGALLVAQGALSAPWASRADPG
jgi:hypothetical protein